MGMPVRIVLHATDTVSAHAAARAAFAHVARLEQQMSSHRADSEVRRLERRPGEWVTLSPELFAVLETALHVARATDGAFDPTVGPLSALWRESRLAGSLPEQVVIDSARTHTGWWNVTLDRPNRAARLAQSGVSLDLGGIAKGFILQQALAVLRHHGSGSALIEAGGDIVAGDAPPGRAGWHVETPYADSVMAARAASLTNAAIATSGPSAQFFIIDGIRYAHVVNPRSGIGLTHDTHATVIATDAALADALATALTVLGCDAAVGVLRQFPAVVATSITRTSERCRHTSTVN